MIDRRDNPDLSSIETVFQWADSYDKNALAHGAIAIGASLTVPAIAKEISGYCL